MLYIAVATGMEMIDKLVKDPRLCSGVPCTEVVGEKEITDELGTSALVMGTMYGPGVQDTTLYRNTREHKGDGAERDGEEQQDSAKAASDHGQLIL